MDLPRLENTIYFSIRFANCDDVSVDSRLITLMEDLKKIFLLLFKDMQNIIKMKFDSANYLRMLI